MRARILVLVFAIWAGATTDLEAQDGSKTARIGLLVAGSESSSRDYLEGLRQGLREQALVEGKNVQLEARYANGRADLLKSLAVELANSGIDLIHAGGDQAASAAKQATDKVPIVAVTCDALAAGLVANLRKPGGNLTGVTCINSDLSGKRVELLKETIPSLVRLGALLNPNDHRMAAELKEAERTARAISIAVHPLIAIKSEDIEVAFSKAAEGEMGGILVIFDSMTFFNRAKLADLAVRNRIATIFNFRQYADAGGLMSFGPNLRDMYRQSARHIQKILRGEAPGEIPMEQPTRFELVINMKTARAISLSIPPPLLARADELIE